MYFSICSLIYFSIFIIYHLPVSLLSPHPSLHPCLLEGNVSAFHFSGFPQFLLFLYFLICTYPKCITQYITIWFYPPEPSPLSGCLATANLVFNLRRGRLLPERQMVRGWGERCWEIHPLTSVARLVILSVVSLYFCGLTCEWERGAEWKRDKGYGKYVGVFAGWQQQSVHSQPTSHPTCIF